jgi:putative OPT family oligopeptide transporter
MSTPRAATPEPAAASPEARPVELTGRALVVGGTIGALLAIANVYMGLKTGWGDQGNLTAAILGFGISRAMWGRSSVLENNIVQTTAASAATVAFTAGLVGAIPALALSGREPAAWAIAVDGLALGLLGLWVGSMLRGALIEREALPFPSSAATAEVIRAMHASARTGLSRARRLGWSAVASAVMVWFRDGRPAFIPAAATLLPTSVGVPVALTMSWSPMFVGTGALLGLRSGLSLLAGGLTAWALLAPACMHWQLIPHADYAALAGWLLWPGVALLTGSLLTSLLLDWRGFARGVADLRALRSESGARGRVALPLLAALAILCVVNAAVFGVAPVFTVAAFAATLLLAAVAARATGETDIAPVTQMGQLVQILVGAIAPQSVASNLLCGHMATGCSTETASVLWAFKTGHLLQGQARRQLIAAAVGLVVGLLVGVPVYLVIARVHHLGTESFPAPVAISWRALARLAHEGGAAAPPGALIAAGTAGALGVLLTIGARSRAAPLMPSPVALGMGMLIPFSYVSAIMVGAVAVRIASRYRRHLMEEWATPLAAGAIVAESLVDVLLTVLVAAHLLAPP